jgi:hypothetical protein
VRAIREAARLHGHDVSPVPGCQPRGRTILPSMRCDVSRGLRGLWGHGGEWQQVLRPLRGSSRGHSAATGRGGPSLRTARELHLQVSGRADPDVEERAGRRAQAGHGPLRRSQRVDGALGRLRPGGGAEAPRSRARADDGGGPPLRGDREPGHGRRDHGALRRPARARGLPELGALYRFRFTWSIHIWSASI